MSKNLNEEKLKNLVNAPVRTAGHERKFGYAAERFTEYRSLVSLIAKTYIASKTASPIVAMNMDPTPERRSARWSPAVAEYIVDVELAIRRTLETKTDADQHEMRDAWLRFLDDDTVLDAAQKRMIRLMAPPFYSRRLHPGLYFKPRTR